MNKIAIIFFRKVLTYTNLPQKKGIIMNISSVSSVNNRNNSPGFKGLYPSEKTLEALNILKENKMLTVTDYDSIQAIMHKMTLLEVPDTIYRIKFDKLESIGIVSQLVVYLRRIGESRTYSPGRTTLGVTNLFENYKTALKLAKDFKIPTEAPIVAHRRRPKPLNKKA